MILDGNKIITNETELVEVFNNHYINIVEKSSGKKSRHVARDNNIENKRIVMQVIKTILKIIQVLSIFRKIFNASIYLRYHIQQLKKLKNCSKKLMPIKLQVLTKFPKNWLN